MSLISLHTLLCVILDIRDVDSDIMEAGRFQSSF